MEINRRVRRRMFLYLMILGNVATVITCSGVSNETGPDLDCTNHFVSQMFCDFGAQNCSEYILTLLGDDGEGETHCALKQCDSGRCCCSVQMILVLGETHTATVWRGNERVESKKIDVSGSTKPQTPNITSVKETNGNFLVMWKATDAGSFRESLTAQLMYHKKGDTEKVVQSFKPTTIDGWNIYEIPGRNLESSTTYVVSVKSQTSWSGRFSDSSNEWEFTTRASPNALIFALIISLSIAAVLISSAIFGCYVKLKTKWWDTVAKCSKPKLLIMHPNEQEFLKPEPPIISSVCVEPLIPDDSKMWSKGSLTDTSGGSPQQSSGISTNSSCLSYANTEPADIIAGVQDALGKAFPNISPISALTTNLLTESNKDSGLFSAPNNLFVVSADDMSSGSSGFDNKTYSILIPSCQGQIVMGRSDVQTQAKMVCDSAYHPSEGDVVTCSDQQAPACPLLNLPAVVSSLLPTDMSYQQHNADSERFSCAEDSSLSSFSSGTITIASCDPVYRVEAGLESFDEVVSGATKPNGKMEEATVCDDNPCYGCLPAGSHSFPPVDDDYQAFQNLVGKPDFFLSEARSGEKEEHLDKYPAESSAKIPPVIQLFTDDVQGGQCLSELQRSFLPLITANQPMPLIPDSGYQSV
ncbi:uncharacterized protein LOC120788110 isoform X3 [Xiphias gladius]|uniref:uncharacterized protein LOC120788110 isoform X3 n=1 Tax=Xiphias gladius TaxID=8245 RepID=UPI001A99EEB2|nr:uncharacterized protein LOC120788110 isoform X3 [Xiphias gladius]